MEDFKMKSGEEEVGEEEVGEEVVLESLYLLSENLVKLEKSVNFEQPPKHPMELGIGNEGILVAIKQRSLILDAALNRPLGSSWQELVTSTAVPFPFAVTNLVSPNFLEVVLDEKGSRTGPNETVASPRTLIDNENGCGDGDGTSGVDAVNGDGTSDTDPSPGTAEAVETGGSKGVGLGSSDIEFCSSLLGKLMSHRDAKRYFNEPVDTSSIPDYADIVERPMDFGTILAKLSRYETKESFLVDVRQVFVNCETYNHPDSVLGKAGARLCRLFEKVGGQDALDTRYEVESILKRMVRGKEDYFLIKWKGYDPTMNSWEPRKNLTCSDLLAEFERTEKEAAGRKRALCKGGGCNKKRKKMARAEAATTTTTTTATTSTTTHVTSVQEQNSELEAEITSRDEVVGEGGVEGMFVLESAPPPFQTPAVSWTGQKVPDEELDGKTQNGKQVTVFSNFESVCKRFNRPPTHVKTFLLSELGTSGSMDATNRLVLSGRFLMEQLVAVLARYRDVYITCTGCGSWDTSLHNDSSLHYLKCSDCGRRHSVEGSPLSSPQDIQPVGVNVTEETSGLLFEGGLNKKFERLLQFPAFRESFREFVRTYPSPPSSPVPHVLGERMIEVEEGVGAENLLGESLQQQDGCEKDTNELYGVES